MKRCKHLTAQDSNIFFRSWWAQSECKGEWLSGISFVKYLETWLQIQVNILLEAWFQPSELLSTSEFFSDSNTSGVVPGWGNLRADHKFVIFLCQSQKNWDTEMATKKATNVEQIDNFSINMTNIMLSVPGNNYWQPLLCPLKNTIVTTDCVGKITSPPLQRSATIYVWTKKMQCKFSLIIRLLWWICKKSAFVSNCLHFHKNQVIISQGCVSVKRIHGLSAWFRPPLPSGGQESINATLSRRNIIQ